MRIGPKYKICKRLGTGIFEKCQTQKFALSEARSVKSRPRRGRGLSDYGKQLLEKQKVRYTYGLSEQQFRRYVREAVARKGVDSAGALLRRLEARLDNVVYRSGLAKTRAMARQMVSHGHIMVNGKRVTIPSYEVQTGDAIKVREGSRARTPFAVLSEEKEASAAPAWLSFDRKHLEGKVTADPFVNPAELLFDLGVVLEFYSR